VLSAAALWVLKSSQGKNLHISNKIPTNMLRFNLLLNFPQVGFFTFLAPRFAFLTKTFQKDFPTAKNFECTVVPLLASPLARHY